MVEVQILLFGPPFFLVQFGAKVPSSENFTKGR